MTSSKASSVVLVAIALACLCLPSTAQPGLVLGVKAKAGDGPGRSFPRGGPVSVHVSLSNRAFAVASREHMARELERVRDRRSGEYVPPVALFEPPAPMAVVIREPGEAWLDRLEVTLLRVRTDGSEEVVLAPSDTKARTRDRLARVRRDETLLGNPLFAVVDLSPQDTAALVDGQYIARAQYRLPSTTDDSMEEEWVVADATLAGSRFEFVTPSSREELCSVAMRTSDWLGRQGDWEGAVAVLEEALERFPDWANGRYYLGLRKAKLGDHAAAAEALAEYLGRVGPRHPRAAEALRHLQEAETRAAEAEAEEP